MEGNGKTITVTDDSFGNEVESAAGLTIVDFWAAWCGPCRIVAPVIEQLANEYDEEGLRVAKVDVDANPAVTMRFGVRSIPSILFFKDGEHVDTVVGAQPKKHLEEKVKAHLGGP